MKGSVAGSRYSYIRAFEDYTNKGKLKEAVDCGVKAVALYYKENLYQEAFDLCRRIDQTISSKGQSDGHKAGLHYFVTKERLRMYMKMRRLESAKGQLAIMENQASAAVDERVPEDLLYSKAIFYYTFGMNSQGNAVFKEMVQKLTKSKEYDKVDDAYKTLIANGRRSNSASMVAESYSSYLAWKDSATALKHADEIKALKQQISDNEATIADKDSSLTTRWAVIIGLSILAGALAAALAVGAIILLRYILLTRKQQKNIKLANDNNALKAKFISNISAQLEPTLKKLDGKQPEVKALLDFSKHIQTLSELENSMDEEVELEDTQVSQFCEDMMDQIRDKVGSDITLKVDAPKMNAKIHRDYVSHILTHLLNNAVIYTPAEGHITLEFKKRGAHTHQFLVSNTGSTIEEENRENIFKPFLEIRDLTKGDGLGLPICKQMALKMKGDLEIDPNFTKGVRFVLELHA
ncbi:MAG: HAMP domain-containing histidine kinase [Prevotella sp.]|nr:HAMP domain-containing histidine kinase [Prevotella sp.]